MNFVYIVDPVCKCGVLAMFQKKSVEITFNHVDKKSLRFSIEIFFSKFYKLVLRLNTRV